MTQEQNIEFALKFKKNAELTEYKGYKWITYTIEMKGEKKPALMTFKGKQKNPYSNYYYPTEESRNTRIAEVKKYADSHEEYKAKRKAERKAFKPEFEIGDIFHASWGWEQTNNNFYQVIGKKGKCTAILREIAQATIEDSTYAHGMADERTALKDQFISDEIHEKRVGQGNCINFESYKSASKWDGQPKYCSWYY